MSSVSLGNLENNDAQEELNACSICINGMSPSVEKIQALPCLHQFHEVCIVPWLANKNTCPNCRGVVKPEPDITVLFAQIAAEPERADELEAQFLNQVEREAQRDRIEGTVRNILRELARPVIEVIHRGDSIQNHLRERPIGKRTRGLAVINAVLQNRLEAVEVLLAKGPIPPDLHEIALQESKDLGFHRITAVLNNEKPFNLSSLALVSLSMGFLALALSGIASLS